VKNPSDRDQGTLTRQPRILGRAKLVFLTRTLVETLQCVLQHIFDSFNRHNNKDTFTFRENQQLRCHLFATSYAETSSLRAWKKHLLARKYLSIVYSYRRFQVGLLACSTEELLYIAVVRDVTSTSIGYICTRSKPRRDRIEGVSSETRRSNTLNDAVYRIVLSAGSGGVQYTSSSHDDEASRRLGFRCEKNLSAVSFDRLAHCLDYAHLYAKDRRLHISFVASIESPTGRDISNQFRL
jgi:hypothetical protein